MQQAAVVVLDVGKSLGARKHTFEAAINAVRLLLQDSVRFAFP